MPDFLLPSHQTHREADVDGFRSFPLVGLGRPAPEQRLPAERGAPELEGARLPLRQLDHRVVLYRQLGWTAA